MSTDFDLPTLLSLAASRAGASKLPFALLKEFLQQFRSTISAESVFVAEVSGQEIREFFYAGVPELRQKAIEEARQEVSSPPQYENRSPTVGIRHFQSLTTDIQPDLVLLILWDKTASFARGHEFAEVTADLYRRELLAILRRTSSGHRFISQFLLSLQTAASQPEILNIVANDAPCILQCRRISLCKRRNLRDWSMVASTSVSDPNDRSAAAQKIAELVVRAERQFGNTEKLRQTVSGVSSGSLALPQQDDTPANESTIDPNNIVEVLPLTLSGEWLNAEFAFVGEWDAQQMCDPNLIALIVRAAATSLEAVDRRSATFWTHLRRRLSGRSGFRKTLLFSIGIIALLVFLIPVDFTIEARGQLEPSQRRLVWAAEDGVVQKIIASDGSRLEAGDCIIQLQNDQLSVQLESLQGEIATSRTRLAAIESLRISRETARDPLLGSEYSEVTARVEALEKQLHFLQTRISNLNTVSPIRGKLFGSGLTERFLGRPVIRGQYFCEIADVDSPWELRLHVGEADTDHLLKAAEEQSGKPNVTFVLATQPGKYSTVPVSTISEATELDASGNLFTEVIVSLPNQPTGNERPGTGVVARIHCGKRTLGYICFRRISEYVAQKLLL